MKEAPTENPVASEDLCEAKHQARAKLQFARIFYEGSSCVCDMRDLEAMTEGMDEYRVEHVWMTRAEFESLPEFEGW